jgi:drug/metabolite transporter (DMT)-like permease
MIQLPVIGALLEATGMILEKKVLRIKKMDYRNYTIFSFFAIVIMSIPFLYFFWKLSADALSLKNIGIFAFVVVVSIAANLFTFYSLKRENVTEFEHLWLMQPLFTILLAFIFYQSERNLTIVALALIASIALVISHIKKHHLAFDKYIIAALLGGFFFAVELVASKPILEFYSPFTFYFFRCFFVLIFSYLIFRSSFSGQSSKTWVIIFVTGLLWVLYRAIIYYGYMTLGIVFTTILFILSPVFMFIFAIVFLKEKPTLRQIIATAVIFICVVLAVIFGK